VWMALTYGFAGMRDYDGNLSFDPKLPPQWGRLRFRLRFHRSRLEVDLTHEAYRFTIIEGDPLPVTVLGTEYTVDHDSPVEVAPT
ncbi:MAG: glycosyl hydrolase family 65 protein, partial [Spirochaetota bacterium]